MKSPLTKGHRGRENWHPNFGIVHLSKHQGSSDITHNRADGSKRDKGVLYFLAEIEAANFRPPWNFPYFFLKLFSWVTMENDVENFPISLKYVLIIGLYCVLLIAPTRFLDLPPPLWHKMLFRQRTIVGKRVYRPTMCTHVTYSMDWQTCKYATSVLNT